MKQIKENRVAYHLLYLEEVRDTLGKTFQLGVIGFGINIRDLSSKYVKSKYARGIEEANPHYLAGFLPWEIIKGLYGLESDDVVVRDYSDMYWIGWAIALVQWYVNKPFSEILRIVPIDRWYHMYNV